jgi:hypothetical protein
MIGSKRKRPLDDATDEAPATKRLRIDSPVNTVCIHVSC